jgi:hypothetical protein
MNLDRRMLRRIINEEANKLGIRLNEKVVGPTGRRGDPVVFEWLPDLNRWEATGKIIDDEKNDMVLNYPVATGGSVGNFTCMSMIYGGTIRFKWVDQNGNKIKSLEKTYDNILALVKKAFDEYVAKADPALFAEIQDHFADHTKADVPTATAGAGGGGGGAGRVAPVVNPLYSTRAPAASPARAPSAPTPMRSPGAAPTMSSPAMSDVQAAMLMDIKRKVEAFIEVSNSLMMYAGTDVPDDVFDAYQMALEDLQNTMNGG